MANVASIDHLGHAQNIVATCLDRPHIAYLTLLSRAIGGTGARRLRPYPKRTVCP
jgi:hypothetical protein